MNASGLGCSFNSVTVLIHTWNAFSKENTHSWSHLLIVAAICKSYNQKTAQINWALWIKHPSMMVPSKLNVFMFLKKNKNEKSVLKVVFSQVLVDTLKKQNKTNENLNPPS